MFLWIPLNKSGILGGSVLLCLVDLLNLACMQQTEEGEWEEWVEKENKRSVWECLDKQKVPSGQKIWQLIQ